MHFILRTKIYQWDIFSIPLNVKIIAALRIESRVWNILMYYSSDCSSLTYTRAVYFPKCNEPQSSKEGCHEDVRATSTKRIIIGRIFIFYYFVGIEQRVLCSLDLERVRFASWPWEIFIFRCPLSLKWLQDTFDFLIFDNSGFEKT